MNISAGTIARTAAWNKVTGALAQLSAANTQTSQVVNTMLGASE